MKCLALEIRIRIIATLNPSVAAGLKYFVNNNRQGLSLNLNALSGTGRLYTG